MKRYLFIASVAFILITLALASCSNYSAETHSSQPKAAIIDQLYLLESNQTFIEETTQILESYGFKVDLWEGEEVTVKFYRELPKYGYKLILFRAHVGILSLVGESEVIPMDITCLFTGEAYTPTKYVAEQLRGHVYEAHMTKDYPSLFAISPRFITDNMRGEFDDAAIIVMGCSSYYLDDMAVAFVEKGASVYLGWSATVTLDYVDGATLNLISNLCTENLTVEQGMAKTMAELGYDPYFHARLKFLPAKSGTQTIRELIK